MKIAYLRAPSATRQREPFVADSARLSARKDNAIDLNAVFHAELRARREERSQIENFSKSHLT